MKIVGLLLILASFPRKPEKKQSVTLVCMEVWLVRKHCKPLLGLIFNLSFHNLSAVELTGIDVRIYLWSYLVAKMKYRKKTVYGHMTISGARFRYQTQVKDMRCQHVNHQSSPTFVWQSVKSTKKMTIILVTCNHKPLFIKFWGTIIKFLQYY